MSSRSSSDIAFELGSFSDPVFPVSAHLGKDNPDTDEYPDGGRKAYTVLLGSFLGLTSNLGVINSIGAVQAYVSQHQLRNVKFSTVSWIFSIYLALAYGIGLFIGPVFDRKGPKVLLIVSTTLITLGFMTAAESSNVWQLILSLSICGGIGNALGMTPLIGVINHWFFLKRGTAIGIATSGGSIGALAIPLLLRHLYANYGFKWAMRILALFCFGCTLGAILLVEERLTKTKEEVDVIDVGEAVTGSNESELQNLSKVPSLQTSKPEKGNSKLVSIITLPFISIFDSMVDTIRNLNFKSLKELKYAFLICGGFCGELGLVLIVTFFPTYAIARGVSESTSYILLSVWNSTGILGRFLPGYFSDYFGKYNMNILMLIGLDISILLLWLPFGSSLKVLYAYASLGGFFLGLILSLLPVCLGQISPVREFGERYGLLVFFLSFGNLVGVPIGAAIIGNESKHNYDMFVVLVAALITVSIFFWGVSRYYIVGLRFNVKV